VRERPPVDQRSDQFGLRLRDSEHEVGCGVDVQLANDLVPVVTAEERHRPSRRSRAEGATRVAQKLRVHRVDHDARVGRMRSEQRSDVLGDLPEGKEGDVEARPRCESSDIDQLAVVDDDAKAPQAERVDLVVDAGSGDESDFPAPIAHEAHQVE
jgi:hypothetical protein